MGSSKKMVKTRSLERNEKRLERLLCSGLRQTQNLESYAAELAQLATDLASPGFFRRKTRLLKTLGNETRLRMLRLLIKREMCVCELTLVLNLTQPTASHHLNVLQNVELVKDRKEGKWVFYSIANREVVQDLFAFLGFPS